MCPILKYMRRGKHRDLYLHAQSCLARATETTLEKGRLGRQTAGQIIRHSSAGAYLSVLRCNERTVTPTYCYRWINGLQRAATRACAPLLLLVGN
jgi:hypothetical protein